VIGGLLSLVQLDRAKRDKVPVGSYRCERCGQVHEWNGPECSPDAADPMSFEQLELRKELKRHLMCAYATIPEGMDWCRLGDPKWREKCCDDGRRFVAGWTKEAGSAVLWGKTGVGKTIAAIALMHRILDAARDLPVDKMPTHKLRWAAGIAFVSGPDLALARRMNKLGAEAPLVELAMRASLLVIDEIGHEYFNPDGDTTLFEVLNHRYLGKKRPTIVTSELNREQLMARYRPAAFRRIGDIGTYVPLKANAKPGSK
jgi:hypothetical protein